ncbi:MAG: flagellin [Clostridium sp.]|nr:flagellin [Clostridium sp.]
MRVKTNVAGLNSARNQGINQLGMGKSLEKLSSGYKIVRAGDNAAGLALSEGMRRQIYGLDQAMRNVNDGIGLVNTGEGALTEVHSMLQRMNVLATESANGTYNDTSRGTITEEINQLLSEIDRIGSSSDFNGIPLFDPDPPAQLPPPCEGSDPDIQLQIGCSQQETLVATRYCLSKEGLDLQGIKVDSVENANAAMPKIEEAVQAISLIRNAYGSVYSHLEHTHRNLSVNKENLQASESYIRDTDVADEFTNFTRHNIMLQASQSMMAQANAVPQGVLSMLN